MASLRDQVARRDADLAAAGARASDEVAALRRELDTITERTAQARAAVATAAASLAASAPSRTDAAAVQVIDVLGTRTLLRAVITTPAIRDQYPTLSEDFDRYLQALGAERRGEGQTEAYAWASSAVEELARSIGATLPASAPPDTAAGYAERLTALLRSALGR